ncbi:MAG: maleylpyruvate isomerase family mycothiol-dependent enzyme [Actinobacteria bacterium]|nr:maleylpyruvate isomerase family mycothiol-dependent enzyme [Actinomycetota bacterium]
MTTPAADRALVDQLSEVWDRLAALCADLTEEEWKRPTAVPGWSVQDNLTHLTDIEAMSLGLPRSEHEAPEGLAHVKNDSGRRNESFVDERRTWTGAAALAEFVDVTGRRLAELRALAPEGFAAESWTPMGPGTVRDLLPFRIFDSWVHEQDIREALDRPGGLGGPAAEAAMDRIVGTVGYVVGKKVAAPDGTVVVIECTEPLARTVVVAVADGRARVLDGVPEDPTVTLTLPGAVYARVACGRADPAAVLAGGSLTLVGDEAIGRRVVEELNFLF